MVGLGDLANIMGKVQTFQTEMQRVQQEMAAKTFQADSGGGMVAATVNGKGDLLGLKIDPGAVDGEDIEMLEDLIVAAVNAAVTKSQQEMKQQMAELTGGLNIPGLDQIGKMIQ